MHPSENILYARKSFPFNKAELPHCFKFLLNMINNFIENVVQNRIIQMFRLNLPDFDLWIGKSLISAARGNKNIITSEGGTCWHNTTGKQAKEFLLFLWFSLCDLHFIILSFSCIQLEGNNKTGKTKASVFFDHGKQNYFCFSVSFFHPPILILYLMLPTQK